MSRTDFRMAALVMLVLGAGGSAAEDPGRAGDLQPVAPVSQLRLFNFRNYGGGGDLSVALSPDGKTLAQGANNSLLLYDLVKSRQPNQPPRPVFLENFYFSNSPLAFLPDGKTVVGLPAQHVDDASVRFWDVSTGKEVRQIDNDQPFFGLAVSPDGKVLALGTQQRVELWDAVSGDEVRVLHGPNTSNYRALAFAPDGKMLATAGGSPAIQLWEVASGKERHLFRLAAESPAVVNSRFPGGPKAVSALAFSADGTILAAGGNDSAIHLWDLLTDEEFPPLVGHSAPIRALVFTPDGKQLVSFDAEGLRLAWKVDRLKLPAGKLPALGDGEFDELWTDLAEADAFRTYRAVRYLTAEPSRAVALLRRQVQPVPPGDTQRIAQLTADLQSPSPGVRRKAMAELRKQGEAAVGALSQMAPGPQNNRAVPVLLRKLEAQGSSPDRARALKAVQVLEQIGTEDARQVLEKLAGGAAGVKLTVEAKAAAERLADPDRKGPQPPANLGVQDLDNLWNELAAADAPRAYRALCCLAAVPQKALPLLRQRLKPVMATDGQRIDQFVAELDSDEFALRQKAAAELELLGVLAEPALKKVLASAPSLETRKRVEQILERLTPGQVPPPETLRAVRAVEVLERFGTAEKKPLLEALARGAPEAALTQDAKAALDRLARRTAAAP
jgi:hypothetical protein